MYKGSRSQDRPESPTVVVRGGMPSLPSSRQGLAVSGGGAPHQDASESDMIDGNANPNVGTTPAPSSLHRPASLCPPPDKSDTESKNFRNRVCVSLITAKSSSPIFASSPPPPPPILIGNFEVYLGERHRVNDGFGKYVDCEKCQRYGAFISLFIYDSFYFRIYERIRVSSSKRELKVLYLRIDIASTHST